MLFSFNAMASGTQTGLSSYERENGILSESAVELIKKHWPDETSGKLNFHYWWKVDGIYYGIHQHNLRFTLDIHQYTEDEILRLVNENNEEVQRQIDDIANKVIALSSIGMTEENIKMFLEHSVDPTLLAYTFSLLKKEPQDG